MKLIIIFLIGCFAIAAQASSIAFHQHDLNILETPIEHQIQFYVRSGVIDKLHDLVDAISKKALEVINDIIDNAKKIVESVIQNVEEIISQSENIAKRIIQNVLDKIEEIAKENENSKKCVEEIFPDVVTVIEESTKKMLVCNKNGMEEAKNIIQDIQVFVDAVHTNIDGLREIVNGCLDSSSNPITVARCVVNEANKLKDQILGIIDNAKKALETVSERAVNIAKETHSCVDQTIRELQKKTIVIVEDVQKCIANSVKPEPRLVN